MTNLKLIASGKLFDLRDSAARITCEFFLQGKIKLAESFVQQFKRYDDELKRRLDEVQ